MKPAPPSKDLPDSESAPVLFHDGCHVCLDIASMLKDSMPGLTVINLSRLRQFKKEAVERGVERLPSLMLRQTVLPIAPHAGIDHID